MLAGAQVRGSGANSVNVLPGVKDDAFAQQVEAGAAVHLAFDHLDPGDVAFHGAGAVGQGEPGGDGVLVAADAVGEGVQFGLVVGLGGGEPAFQFLLAAAAGHDLGEAAHVGGQGVQVGAGVLDGGGLRSLVVSESGGGGGGAAGGLAGVLGPRGPRRAGGPGGGTARA